MNIQFGASTFIWVSPFNTASFHLVEKVKEMGYDILEVAVEDKDLIDWPTLKELAKEADIKITISGAFGPDRDISSTDAAVRKNGLNYINDCVRIAADMGSPILQGPFIRQLAKQELYHQSRKNRSGIGVLKTYR